MVNRFIHARGAPYLLELARRGGGLLTDATVPAAAAADAAR